MPPAMIKVVYLFLAETPSEMTVLLNPKSSVVGEFRYFSVFIVVFHLGFTGFCLDTLLHFWYFFSQILFQGRE